MKKLEEIHLSKTAGASVQPISRWSLVVWLLFLSTSHVTNAQSLSIDWSTIDGGGGTCTGGVFAVSGSVGQADANLQPLAGGNFSLAGGFWSLFAVQTPGGPRLTIRLTTTNTALVSWPSSSPGFSLQHSHDLSTTNWMTAPEPVSDNGTNRFIIVTPPTGNRFYRLYQP